MGPLLFATGAKAQHPTDAAGTLIRVPSFMMSDQSILGFNLGPLTTVCEPSNCPANGYIVVDWNAYVPGAPETLDFIKAHYWFYDAEGNRLDVTATMVPAGPFIGFADTLYMTSLEFAGPDILFDNGFSIDGWRLDFFIEDAQVFGEADLFLHEFNDGYFFGYVSGSPFEYEDFLGEPLSYSQEGEQLFRPMTAIPAPEPGLSVMLGVGSMALAIAGRRREG
jgi:hypothetical protein